MADSRPVNSAVKRPLSPHLQIYRPMLTMMMSIMHRITGVALFFGSILFVWWLTWALIHHMLGGLRHFLWDVGKGFELKTVENLARLNLVGSIFLTVLLWVIAYGVKP
jgi:succinate dehydrogenase / fumarate reductase, cytochrome b subunit